MRYTQHTYVGDSIVVGGNVHLPGNLGAKGRVFFTREERIELTDHGFLTELKRYNGSMARLGIRRLREEIEHGRLTAEVRRSFGDVNGWSGDHAKLNPPDGKRRKFEDLGVVLQEIANTKDFEYVKLATANWDHFMPMSQRIWWLFHREALRLARRFAGSGRPGPRIDRKNKAVVFDLNRSDLARALFLDAYGCHFLEDCFAAGHLRTPRLLFGRNPLVALRAKDMHDEDNERRLHGFNGQGRAFQLIGEDGKKDDFAKLAEGKKDPAMKALLAEVVAAVAASVQQVLDVALVRPTPKRVRFTEVTGRVPRVQVSWRPLGPERSRTHALEIWPEAEVTTPKPLYKIHADYNEEKRCFESPILIKRTDDDSWRRVYLGGDVDSFTPGKKLAWWIPDHPQVKRVLP